MLAMCLGMVADFDERAGNHDAAIAALEQAIELNDMLGLRGFNAALLARLGWALLHADDPSSAEVAYQRRARTRPAPRQPARDLPRPHRPCGRAPPRRPGSRRRPTQPSRHSRLHLAGGPRRLANRIDPRADVLTATAACCTVLGCIAADAGRAEQAAQLLGHAAHLRTEAGVPEPPFLSDDIARATEAATVLLGPDGFAAAFGAVRTVNWALTWTSRSDADSLTRRLSRVQRQGSVRSAALRMVGTPHRSQGASTHDHRHRPHQALRPPRRRRRPDVRRRRRPRHRFRRPERRRQVDHHADDGRPHPARPW